MARQGAYVTQPEAGGEVRRLHEVQSLPRVLALLLGLVAMLGVAHTLWATPRRRRRDLATLRALGFTPVQVRRVLHTQAAVLATVGLAGGIVGGVIAGRLAWEAAAESIGVPTDLSVRPLSLLFIVAAALIGARLLAVLPGRVAGRATPAHGLRDES
jgi:putative ABC transport system permease protein